LGPGSGAAPGGDVPREHYEVMTEAAASLAQWTGRTRSSDDRTDVSRPGLTALPLWTEGGRPRVLGRPTGGGPRPPILATVRLRRTASCFRQLARTASHRGRFPTTAGSPLPRIRSQPWSTSSPPVCNAIAPRRDPTVTWMRCNVWRPNSGSTGRMSTGPLARRSSSYKSGHAGRGTFDKSVTSRTATSCQEHPHASNGVSDTRTTARSRATDFRSGGSTGQRSELSASNERVDPVAAAATNVIMLAVALGVAVGLLRTCRMARSGLIREDRRRCERACLHPATS
jgi:hypothetical protein